MDCIFCKIIAGEIPSDKVYEDDELYAFRDISPQAPTHILLIPKEHRLQSAREISSGDGALLERMFIAATHIAKEQGLEKGYRLVTNSGEDAGQTVFHLHMHILGGGQLGAMA